MNESISLTIPLGNKDALLNASRMLEALAVDIVLDKITPAGVIKQEIEKHIPKENKIIPTDLPPIVDQENILFPPDTITIMPPPPVDTDAATEFGQDLIDIDTEEVLKNATVTTSSDSVDGSPMLLTGSEVDSKGRIWDGRINPKSKLKVEKTGEWKLIRNIEKNKPGLIEQVYADMDAAIAAPVVTIAPEVPAVTVIPPPAKSPLNTVIPLLITTGDPFVEFMQKLTERQTSDLAIQFAPHVLPTLRTHNIESIPALRANLALIPIIDAELDTIWNSLSTQN